MLFLLIATISTSLQAEMTAAPVVVTEGLPTPEVKTLRPSDFITSPCCKFDEGDQLFLPNLN